MARPEGAIDRAGAVRAGWGTAVAGAAGSAAVLLAVSEGMAFAVWAVGRRTGAPVAVARAGGLLFELFHRVSLVFAAPGGGAGAAANASSFAVALAPMLGAVLAAALLSRVGRAVAREAGGGPGARILHGLKPAVPYAAIGLVVAVLSRVPALPIPSGGLLHLPPTVSIHAAYLGAFLWPLAFAAVMGATGGALAIRDQAASGRELPVRAVVAGGWTMLWAGLALSFAGLLVLGAVHPGGTAAYFRAAFGRGPGRGLVLVGLNLLVAPNMAAWVLGVATGGCVAVSLPGAASSGCVLSWTRFPSGSGLTGLLGFGVGAVPPAGLSHPPPAYFLFLLAPAVAVLAGGAVAARRVPDASRPRGAAAGAAAGVLFGVLAFLVAVVASVVVRLTGAALLQGGVATGRAVVSVGPRPIAAGLTAAAWGVVGGAIGGFARRSPGRHAGRGAGAT